MSAREEIKLANTQKDDHSEIMDIAFHHQFDGSRDFKIAWMIALYAVLAMIWAPGWSWGDKDYKVYRDEEFKPVKRKVLKPPVEVPVERVLTKKKSARKVPMPDLTPNDPEPIVEPEEPEIPEVVAGEEWEIGIPDAPPEPGPRDEIARVGMIGVESPIFTKKIHPDYPALGKRLKLTGYVLLEAVLRKDGSIDDIKVLRNIGEGRFGFEDKAIEALKKWQFMPGKVNGRPANVRMTLKVDFQLYNNGSS